MLLLALKGIAAGVLCGLPFGPAGLLCLDCTLREGRRVGLAAAAGIAAAHAAWCLTVATQVDLVSVWMVDHGSWVRTGLGALLCGLGWRAWRGVARPADARSNKAPATGGFASTLLLVACNPATALTVAVAIWLAGVEPRGLGWSGVCELAGALFAGAMLLWGLLTGLCVSLGAHRSERTMALIRRGAAGVLVALGTANLAAGVVAVR
jgi:threonine/homoserine/homoserine lactone efflux protein